MNNIQGEKFNILYLCCDFLCKIYFFSVLVDWILTILIDEMRTVIYFFKLRNWALVENRRIIIFICQSPLVFQKYYISCSFAILLCVCSKLLGRTIQYRMTVPQINCQNILKETIISNTNIVHFFFLCDLNFCCFGHNSVGNLVFKIKAIIKFL